MRLSIRWKLMFFVCTPLVAINGALLAWDYTHQKQEAIEQMAELISDKARTSADQLGARLESIMQVADLSASVLSARGTPSDQQIRQATSESLRQSSFVMACAIATEPGSDGGSRASALARRMPGGVRQVPFSELVSEGYPDPAWYTAVKQTLKPAWTPGTLGGQSVPVNWYAAPILEHEQLRGVVAIAMRAQALQTILIPRPRTLAAVNADSSGTERPRGRARARNGPAASDSAQGAAGDSNPAGDEPELPANVPNPPTWSLASQFGPDGFVILDRQQRIVSHTDAARIGKPWLSGTDASRDPRSAADAWSEMLTDGHGAVPVHYLSDDVEGLRPDTAHWIAFAQIPAAKWIFATTIPQSLVVAPIVDQLQHRALLLLAGVIAVAIIIILVSIHLSRPIVKLARAVERLSGGDLDAQAEGVRNRDELGTLAQGFNSMVGKLKEQMAALARETASRESIESELRIARQIQQDLLPHPTPALVGRPDFDLHAVNVPARRVAGDFYDYFFVGDKLIVVIADVSGKGMPAALLMAVARTVVRDFASLNLAPAEIAIHANQTIFEGSDDSMFVTMFLAQYEPGTGRLVYVCAGHPPPYVLSAHGATKLGKPTAPLLGVFGGAEIDQSIHQDECTLQPGETLFLYTDGVTDARSPSGRMIREEGLVHAFAKLGNEDPHSLCKRVLAGLRAHEQGGQADDITMLALRRTT